MPQLVYSNDENCNLIRIEVRNGFNRCFQHRAPLTHVRWPSFVMLKTDHPQGGIPISPFQLTSSSEADTNLWGQRLADHAIAGDVFLLYGDIGAGKSVFARAFIKKFLNDNDVEVPSPTYTLVQTYERGEVEIWHADLYRLTSPSELDALSLHEAFGSALCLVEWPEMIRSMPEIKGATEIWFEQVEQMADQRKLHIRPGNSRITEAFRSIQAGYAQ